jgi:predicted dehydrogenase
MRKAKVALVGLGGWGKAGLENVRSAGNMELVTWFDTNPEVAAKLRDDAPVPPAASWEEILDNQEVEGVLLVVPNHVHAALAVEAAGRGKHVWIEKPIANTLAEADAMIEACDEAGVILQVGHSMRRTPCVRLAKKMMDDGKVGDPVLIEGHQSHRGGWSLTPQMWRWYSDKCPGGPMNVLGVHQIDTMHYLFGPSAEVTAFFAKKYMEYEADEFAALLIKFETGLLGSICSSYISPPRMSVAISGTTGRLDVDYIGNQVTHSDVKGNVETTHTEKINLVADEYREFGECILTGKRPETGGPEGRAAIAVLEAAITSARTGKTVKV